MSEENTNTEQTTEQNEVPKELTTEQSLNLLVNLARQSKLSYDEHAIVDRAVRNLSEALNLKT
jgi:predicted amidohydrolase YtcJ